MMPSYYCKKTFGMCSSASLTQTTWARHGEALNDGNYLLTLVKATDTITAGSVIKAAKKRADELTALTNKTILPSITSQAEAQEEADDLSLLRPDP